ncbi:MAG: cadherin-like domain-containing protein [Colwellia sp.]|nr:cadherin-like domain-containing protein [Colwellia sp.]
MKNLFLGISMSAGILLTLFSANAAETNAIEGTLSIEIDDYANHAQLRYWLKDKQGKRTEVLFEKQHGGLKTDQKLRVNGRKINNKFSVESEANILTLAGGGGDDGGSNGGTAALTASSLGEQRTLVLMANFQENPSEQPLTEMQARELVFGEVSDFFYENSSQQTWLAGDVFGWYTLPLSNSICHSRNEDRDAADQAAIEAGVDLSTYSRIVYLFTSTPCGTSGSGTVGGNPSRATIHGHFTADTIAHEMGHNFGLYHSKALDCHGETLASGCNTIEYGDTYDVMGNPDFGHFNAYQKERLGWLDTNMSSPITVVQTDGTYTIDAYETLNTKPKALKISRGINPVTGVESWFYIEYRQAIGFDSFLSSRSYSFYRGEVTDGVVVRLVEDNGSGFSQLLHLNLDSLYSETFGGTDWYDPALTVGASYFDADSGVTIRTEWASATDAGISVSFGKQNQTCAIVSPQVSMSPVSQSASAGTTLSYTVAITNQDNENCAASIFSVQSSVATGWTVNFSATTLDLMPGETAVTTMTVTSSASALTDSYNLSIAVSDAREEGHAQTASAIYTVTADAPNSNTAPVTVNDQVLISSKSSTTITVLSNDYDVDGDMLTITAVTKGAKGSVKINSDGSITYTPAKSFKKSDTFTYTVSDGSLTSTASVFIKLQSSDGGGKGRKR